MSGFFSMFFSALCNKGTTEDPGGEATGSVNTRPAKSPSSRGGAGTAPLAEGRPSASMSSSRGNLSASHLSSHAPMNRVGTRLSTGPQDASASSNSLASQSDSPFPSNRGVTVHQITQKTIRDTLTTQGLSQNSPLIQTLATTGLDLSIDFGKEVGA